MYIVKDIKILHKKIQYLKKNNKTIGLIPTMGSIHDGHVQLILLSKKYVDITVVSIFINPMQFDNLYDFNNYPITFKNDCKILSNNKVDILFCPNVRHIYPNGIKYHTFIDIPKLSNILEGQSRPGHFQGVTTIVSKLFNLIQPNISFFGEKDHQQLLIIKKMVKQLNYMIKIISLPTIRLTNGLALSSRNKHLNSKEIKIAPYLYEVIKKTYEQIIIEEHDMIDNIINESRNLLLQKGFVIDIFNVYDYNKLHIIAKKTKKMIILASVWLGKTRLIDNKKIFLN